MTRELKINSIGESRRVESEEKILPWDFTKFFTLSPDMLLILGFDGYIKQVNPVCEETLLFTKEDFLSLPLLEFVVTEYREYTVKQLQKLTNGIETISFENRCLCKDGSSKWLKWKATISQEQQLIYAVVRDVTVSKQQKQVLRETEERYRLLVESVKDYAIYMLDPEGRVISWNSGAERLKQYRADEIIGKHFSCFYPSEYVKLGKPEQELRLAVTEGRFEDEGWRIRKDGSRFWANAVVTVLRDKEGNIRGFAKVTRDITERKLAQEKLQKAHDDLEIRVQERTAELTESNQLLQQEINVRKQTETALRQSKARLKEQAKELAEALQELKRTQTQLIQTEKMSSLGQLVAGIAHEINNPTTFIYCNLDYANRYMKDLLNLLKIYQQTYPQTTSEIEEAAEEIDLDFLLLDLPKLLSSMKLGAKRINQIVLSLRNFARHDEAEMKLANIHEGIDSTISLLQNRLKATDGYSGIQLIQAYGDLPFIECYPGLLNQVFMNILTNAIDALENYSQSSVITICTEVKQDKLSSNSVVVVRIADNGPGMKEEVRHKMFDPFFTTKPVGKGIGLGLSICYQIVVEKHGGKLSCVSQLGKGAEFIIEIPSVQQLKKSISLHSHNVTSSMSQPKSTSQQSLLLG